MTESHANKKAREGKLFSQQGAKLEKFSTISMAIGFETLQVTGAEEAKAGVNKLHIAVGREGKRFRVTGYQP